MKRVEIALDICIRVREGYDSVDLVERRARITIPPGDNPVNALYNLMEEERSIINKHLFQFPEQNLIEAPKGAE